MKRPNPFATILLLLTLLLLGLGFIILMMQPHDILAEINSKSLSAIQLPQFFF